MAVTIKFYPNLNKRSKTEGTTPIYLRLIANGLKAEGKTSIFLYDYEIKSWRSNYINPKSKLYEDLLPYRSRFTDYKQVALKEGIHICIKKMRDYVLQKSSQVQKECIKSYFENYYNSFILPDSRKSSGTQKNYYKSFKHFYSFLEYKQIESICFNEIDLDFGEEFKIYLLAKLGDKNALAESTANGTLKKIKQVFRKAYNTRKLNINVFESIRLSPKSIPKSQLTIEHIKRIYDLDLKPHSTLNYCKVLFLAQSFSGLAYDDLITLKESDFDSTIEGKILLYKQRKKTGINTTQIINSQFEIIIKYYINDSKINQRTTIFPSISNQKYNAYLKLIAELAKINIPLSSHYARHAFSQFLEEAGNEDTKAEYEIMGWSRKGKMDYVYNRVPQQKLLNVTEKLNLYLNNHLYSNEFSEGSPYLATCNNKDSFCLMMLKAPLI